MAAPITGVYLDAGDTALIVKLIDAYGDMLSAAGKGRVLGASVVKLRVELERANARVKAHGPSVRASVNPTGGEKVPGQGEIHGLIDSRQAAAILGITPGGVRHRARTGKIGSRRVAGRWAYSLADCERVAAEQAHGLRR
ncbi:hypothetical protein ACIBED_00935 [Rhodococcus coprophilus]|uniref:hypothetical protein n=1 Tax=Rhodococcus coprophilus TaxID=38310 RepID=UPI0037AB1818